jgi:NADPH-dependent glutamate synthase beta subunit-like oxidoreductase
VTKKPLFRATTLKPTDTSNHIYFHKVIDCQYACPAHTPVPEYIRLIANREYTEAYMINWKSNVFPGILGRICDRPCEPACRRGRVEKEPVAICRLKRGAADNRGEIKSLLPEIPAEKNGKRIALIGGGPASLTVGCDLAVLGYQLDLYDNQARAGGFMRSQVPSFRLPEEVLNTEVDYILDMDITTLLNCEVTSLKEITDKGYDAVFIGTGAPRGRDFPDIPGRQEGDKAIFVGIEWLAGVVFGHVKKTGKKVLVLGGGNTAMDCCRTARRMGGDEVKVVVRSPQADMKASPWEIEDAIAEDIPIIENHVPLEFVVKDGRLIGMQFEKIRAEYGADGKRTLIPTGEEPVFMECDEVLLAVGQQNAFPWIEKGSGIDFTDRGLPVLDEITLQTTVPHIFVGGDAAFGPANVITAVAHGHRAAISIDLYCKGKDLRKRPAPQVTLADQKLGFHDWIYDSHVSDDLRQIVPHAALAKTLKDRLVEVELGFDNSALRTEAERCYNCDVQTVFETDLCIECDACTDICPTNCINFIGNGDEDELRKGLTVPATNLEQPLYVSTELPTGRVMVKDENVCLHCGLCAERCPTAAWKMLKFVWKSPLAGDENV